MALAPLGSHMGPRAAPLVPVKPQTFSKHEVTVRAALAIEHGVAAGEVRSRRRTTVSRDVLCDPTEPRRVEQEPAVTHRSAGSSTVLTTTRRHPQAHSTQTGKTCAEPAKRAAWEEGASRCRARARAARGLPRSGACGARSLPLSSIDRSMALSCSLHEQGPFCVVPPSIWRSLVRLGHRVLGDRLDTSLTAAVALFLLLASLTPVVSSWRFSAAVGVPGVFAQNLFRSGVTPMRLVASPQ
jgi:hypothetical protein